MNLLKSLLVVLILSIPAVANSQPYDLDQSGLKRVGQKDPKDFKRADIEQLADLDQSGLKRVGQKDLQDFKNADFESGNYRLDPDFKLGYGDSVTINLWGKLEGSYNLTIGRDGDVIIPLIGRVKLFGLTMDQAYTAVMSAIDRKYSNVDFSVNLAGVQDIRIDILGYAQRPGTYAISPFCRVVEALAKCGGPNKNGSLCDVQVIRGGSVITNFNLYSFLRENDQSQNIRLKHGDTIFIPQLKSIIAIKGDIGYPGIYEVENNAKLSSLLAYSGGILPTTFERKLLVLRGNAETNIRGVFKEVVFKQAEVFDKKDDVILENGDMVIVTTKLDYTPKPEPLYKTIYINGEFVISGEYLANEKDTLFSVIEKAGGLEDDAFAKGAVYTKKVVKNEQKSILNKLVRAQERAILEEEAYIAGAALLTEEERQFRQRAIRSRKKALDLMASHIPEGRIIINLEDILKGKADITLSDGDIIYVPLIPDWVLVSGAVNNSQSVFFKKGKDLDYYTNITGGLTNLADKESIYVIKADGSAESQSTGIGTISRGDIIIVPEKTN